MKILITGASGFIGRNLAERLKGWGHELVLTDLFPHDESVEQMDAIFPASSLFRGVDAVVHLAAATSVVGTKDVCHYYAQNVGGTVGMLTKALEVGVRRFVNISTAGALNRGPCAVARESSRPEPLSAYGASKAAAEAFASCMAHNNMSVTTLRLGNVYGPHSSHKPSLIARAMHCAKVGELLRVYGDGKSLRDFVHVDDVCDAIDLALRGRDSGMVYNIASGESRSVNDVVDAVRTVSGRQLPVHYEPRRLGELHSVEVDISLAKREMQWQPVVKWKHGLRRLWDSIQ